MRGEDRRTLLRPEPFRPGLALPLSVLGHVAVFGGLWAFSGRAPSAQPLIDPQDVVEVSLVSLPSPKAAVPQKAMRKATPPPPPRADPVPKAIADPDIAPLDTEPPPDAKQERDARREELMRQMKREALLDDLRAAPEGPQDQSATPSAGDQTETGSGQQALGDAERARYSEQVRQVFYRDFSPLQDQPGLAAVAWVWVDAQGKVLRHRIQTPSGDGSFDAAVERAIRLVSDVPAPPSELVASGELRLDLVFRTDDR